ncbi:MAG: class II aldolase/adducin family protein [Bacteroidales bacterium]|nr:class II aldolase/adducin family protein [Bacteroidales bacterium]
MSRLDQLIEISRYYGDNPAYVIAGGGNTSFKTKDTLWIKASGIPLAGIGEEGFVSLSREKLALIGSQTFSEDAAIREEEVKARINEAVLSPKNLRPSVETSLHNLIDYSYVIHTHPTLVNALMCASHATEEVERRFGDRALMVEYTDPGYILFKKMQQRIGDYRAAYGQDPRIIFLQNHGVFVGADSVEEIKELYGEIDTGIKEGKDLTLPSVECTDYRSPVIESLSAYFSVRSLLTRSVNCDLVSHFTRNQESLAKVSKPFSPDIIVYCKSNYLRLEPDVKPGEIAGLIEQFEKRHGYYPKVILQEGGGLTLVEENTKSLETVQEVFTDLMKISYLSEQYGGPHFMTAEQIRFIDNWEVENYRRKVAKRDLE